MLAGAFLILWLAVFGSFVVLGEIVGVPLDSLFAVVAYVGAPPLMVMVLFIVVSEIADVVKRYREQRNMAAEAQAVDKPVVRQATMGGAHTIAHWSRPLLRKRRPPKLKVYTGQKLPRRAGRRRTRPRLVWVNDRREDDGEHPST